MLFGLQSFLYSDCTLWVLENLACQFMFSWMLSLAVMDGLKFRQSNRRKYAPRWKPLGTCSGHTFWSLTTDHVLVNPLPLQCQQNLWLASKQQTLANVMECLPIIMFCNTWLHLCRLEEDIFLLVLKKKADILWIAYGKGHMTGNHKWPLGIEISTCWQPARKWEPQSHSFRWVLSTTWESVGAYLSPSSHWWDCNPT